MSTGHVDAGLIAEVTGFLFYEARLLDSGRLNEWLDLLDDGIRYHGPSREWLRNPTTSRTSTEGFAFDLFDDDKPSLRMRVDRLLGGLAYSDIPASLTQHLISNVEVETTETPAEVLARSKFMVVQIRPGRNEGKESIFFGDRVDRLRRAAGSWRICAREINLSHDVLPRAISVLF